MLTEAKEIVPGYDIGYEDGLIKILLNISTLLYLMIFGIFLYVEFVRTTMRVVEWPDNMFDIMRHCLWWIVGIKLFLHFLNGDLNLRNTIYIIIVLTVGIITSKNTQEYEFVLDVAVLSVGALDVDFNLILKLYFVLCLIVAIHVMIQSKTGEVVDLIHYRDGHIRDAFGFIYPTDFAAHIFYIICAWVLIRMDRITYPEVILMIAIAGFLEINCHARCSVMTVMLLVVTIIFFKETRCIDDSKLIDKVKSVFNHICIVMPWLLSYIILFLGMSKFDNVFVGIINKLLSNRVAVTRQAFDRYNIKIWGQYVHMIGNGGNTVMPKDAFFLDSSYVNMILRLGLATFLVVMIGINIITIRNRNNRFLVCVLMIICLHSLIEHHLFEYYYNFFIILPLANFNFNNIRFLKTNTVR